MLRTAWFWIVTVPATAFFSTVSIVGGLLRAPASLHDWVHRNWGRTELWAAGVRTTVIGLENVSHTTPQIFVANHQSIFDIFAILAYVPASVRFVAKKELGRIPIFSLAMRTAGHIFIDRQDRRGAAEAMRRAGARMKRYRLSLGLFPEGTRSQMSRAISSSPRVGAPNDVPESTAAWRASRNRSCCLSRTSSRWPSRSMLR